MKRCFVFAAGAFYGLRARPEKGDLQIAADAGYLLCRREGLRPDLVIGDFDSMPEPEDADSAPHILSLSFDGVRGEVMRNALEGEGVLVSTGSACASHKQKVSPTLRAMGLSQAQADGTVRVSLGAMNTMDEMDEAARHMLALYRMLRQFKRR